MNPDLTDFKLPSFKADNYLEKERFMKKFNLLHDKKEQDKALPDIKVATKYLSKFVDKELGGTTLREKLTLDQIHSQRSHESVLKDFC